MAPEVHLVSAPPAPRRRPRPRASCTPCLSRAIPCSLTSGRADDQPPLAGALNQQQLSHLQVMTRRPLPLLASPHFSRSLVTSLSLSWSSSKRNSVDASVALDSDQTPRRPARHLQLERAAAGQAESSQVAMASDPCRRSPRHDGSGRNGAPRPCHARTRPCRPPLPSRAAAPATCISSHDNRASSFRVSVFSQLHGNDHLDQNSVVCHSFFLAQLVSAWVCNRQVLGPQYFCLVSVSFAPRRRPVHQCESSHISQTKY